MRDESSSAKYVHVLEFIVTVHISADNFLFKIPFPFNISCIDDELGSDDAKSPLRLYLNLEEKENFEGKVCIY